MVGLNEVFMIDANSKIDGEALNSIWQSGRSRIPVCDGERTNIIGMLFAKDLLVVRAEDALPVRTVLSFYGQKVLKVWSDQHLDAIFTGTLNNSMYSFLFFLFYFTHHFCYIYYCT